MNASIPVNEFILFDDMTAEEIVLTKIDDLVAAGTIVSEFAALTWRIHSDMWKMTYRDIFNVVSLGEPDDGTGPFADAMFGGELDYGDMPNEEWWKEHLGVTDWSLSLAQDIAHQLINSKMNVIVTDSGDEAEGIENCSVIILHKKTLAQAGVGKAVNELVDEIGKRQEEIRRETGVTLAPVQVFIHEGDLESLEVLGKPVVPLRLV